MHISLKPLLSAIAVLISVSAAGQGITAGIINSPKSLGLEIKFTGAEKMFRSLSLSADTFGLLSGKETQPGVKLTYCNNYILKSHPHEEFDVDFFIGPGITVGYVRDTNKDRSLGGIVALSGSLGWSFHFRRSVDIDVSWNLDAGLHLHPENNRTKVSLYKNGLFLSPIPMLTISKRF